MAKIHTLRYLVEVSPHDCRHFGICADHIGVYVVASKQRTLHPCAFSLGALISRLLLCLASSVGQATDQEQRNHR